MKTYQKKWLIISIVGISILLFINAPRAHAEEAVMIDDSLVYAASRKGIEYFFLPALYFNSATIGFSHKKNSLEHVYSASSYFGGGFMPTSFDIRFSYNINRYLNKNFYLPIWLRVSNTRRDVGFEEGYFPHTLRFSIGSGIGVFSKIFSKNYIRSEIGAGYSLNLTNASGDVFPYRTNFRDYSKEKYYPKHYPLFIPAIRFRFVFGRVI
jgi:hypothetical protein